jgi:hypothetical protein
MVADGCFDQPVTRPGAAVRKHYLNILQVARSAG